MATPLTQPPMRSIAASSPLSQMIVPESISNAQALFTQVPTNELAVVAHHLYTLYFCGRYCSSQSVHHHLGQLHHVSQLLATAITSSNAERWNNIGAYTSRGITMAPRSEVKILITN
jgi:hypothetical protein